MANNTLAMLDADEDVIQLVGIRLGMDEYAMDILCIQEIVRVSKVTVVPRSDGYILGVINFRGKIIPLVDLRVRFNMDKTDYGKTVRIVIAKFDRENVGFVVDEVTQVIRIFRSMIDDKLPLVGTIASEYVLGICKYDGRLLTLLDAEKIVDASGAESILKKRLKYGEVKPVVSELVAAKPEQSKPAATLAPAPVAEDDIDVLIAAELAKREAETDAMLAQRRADTTGADTDTKDTTDTIGLDDIARGNQEIISSIDTFSSLQPIAIKIMDGADIELGGGVQREFSELLRLISDIKSLSGMLPDDKAQSSTSLLECAGMMGEAYQQTQNSIAAMLEAISKGNVVAFEGGQADALRHINNANAYGVHIQGAIEHSSEVDGKLRSVIKLIADVGARLGVIISFFQPNAGSSGAEYEEFVSGVGQVLSFNEYSESV
ncbi:hypothetical protein RsTz2092_13010 [Deferribacterales bacterium RsTz2092]|nr:hypothetical protein AGMMS49941_12010 [Deferribacterales bacterium]